MPGLIWVQSDGGAGAIEAMGSQTIRLRLAEWLKSRGKAKITQGSATDGARKDT